MGRGRAKAKQAKIAYKLKYEGGPSTDLSQLAQELGAFPAVRNGKPDDADTEGDDQDTDTAAIHPRNGRA